MTSCSLARCLLLGMLLGSAASVSCNSDSGEDCTPGADSCECNAGQCLAGLTCLSGLCVPNTSPGSGDDGSSSPPTGADTSPGDDGVTTEDDTTATMPTGDAGESGPAGCQGTDGTIGCPCLAGNECLGDLDCDSQQTCICLSGTPCGESNCVEDFQTDDRHCGACGNPCETVGNTIGRCTSGECAPTLGMCIPSVEATTCDAACQAQGRTCVAQGCGENTRTWYQYGNPIACERHSHAGGGTHACSDLLAPVLNQDYVRCCCTQ